MLYRLFKYSLKNILRNKFLSLSSVVVLGVLMFFVNLLMIVQNLSEKLIQNINEKLTISLYLKDEFDDINHEHVAPLIASIEEKLPETKIVFRTKEQTLADMQSKDPQIVEIVWVASNPLPPTLTIYNIHLEDYEKLNTLIENKYGMLDEAAEKQWYDYRSQYARIFKVTAVLKMLQFALYVIISVFLLSIFIITYSIIGNFIYHYRNEIHITKLVGWGNNFIYGPFIFQGILYAILGFILSTALFLFMTQQAINLFPTKAIGDQSLKIYIFNDSFIKILILQLLVFIITWAVGAYLSSKRYMTQNS